MKNIVPSIVGDDGQPRRRLVVQWTRKDGSQHAVGVDFSVDEDGHVSQELFSCFVEDLAFCIRNHH